MESFRVAVIWSRPESFRVVWCQSESFGVARRHFVYRPLFRRPTPTPDDSEKLRFRTTPRDSGRFPTILDDSERLRIMQGGPTFRSRFRISRSRIGVDSVFLLTLPITSSESKSPRVTRSRYCPASIIESKACIRSARAK